MRTTLKATRQIDQRIVATTGEHTTKTGKNHEHSNARNKHRKSYQVRKNKNDMRVTTNGGLTANSIAKPNN